MLGLWHRGDWLKERFGSAMSMVGWYMEVLNLVGFVYDYGRSKLQHQDLNEITLIIKFIAYNNNKLYIILINNI